MATIRLRDYESPGPAPAVDARAWYDRHVRLWVVQRIDADGGQVGDAEHVVGAKAARRRADELRAEIAAAAAGTARHDAPGGPDAR